MKIKNIVAELVKAVCLLGIVYAQSYPTGIFYVVMLIITIILKEEFNSN